MAELGLGDGRCLPHEGLQLLSQTVCICHTTPALQKRQLFKNSQTWLSSYCLQWLSCSM